MHRVLTIYACAAVAPIAMVLQSTAASLRPDSSIVLILITTILFYSTWLIALVLFVLLAALRRRWLYSTHGFIAFVLTSIAFFPSKYSGDYLHLAICYPGYLSVVYAHPLQEVFRFEWKNPADYIGGAAGMGPIEIVYDRSGKIAATVGKKRRLTAGELRGEYIITEHFIGNFYMEKTY